MVDMQGQKPFFDHPALVQRMESLGMRIDSPAEAELVLKTVGYHRLLGYGYLFRVLLPEESADPSTRTYRSDEYEPGTTLEAVASLHAFDGKLRRVLLDGITDFEVRLRTAMAHVLARRDPVAHTRSTDLDEHECGRPAGDSTKLERWLETCEAATRDASQDDFVVHHRATRSETLPVWATLELVSFGKLPFLLDLMKQEDRNEVARQFGVRNGRAFTKWVRALVDVRNRCAHQARVFNHSFKSRVKVVEGAVEGESLADLAGLPPSNRLYVHAAVLAHMLRAHVGPSDWPRQFRTVLRKLPDHCVGIPAVPVVQPDRDMGFPEGWEGLPLWSDPGR